MNIKYKLTAGMATAAMIAGVFAPAALASTVTISKNGVGSSNFVAELSLKSVSVKQKNVTVANTAVVSTANTGGNKTNFNTGGSTTSTTGKATSTVVVSVSGGDNTASLPDCGCPHDDNDVTIKDNGDLSKNTVLIKSIDLTKVSQSNLTVANTYVSSSANTGGNSTSFNTGGGADSGTGNASSSVGVVVSGGNNDLN